MMRDKLTRREDRALLRALRELVLTQYPNPERKDCPGTSIIGSIAMKRIPMLDPAHEHVANCSPCFKELTEIQRRLHRRNIFLWAVTTAGTAIVIMVVLLPYFANRRQEIPAKRETAQTERPIESPPATQPNVTIQPGPSAPAPLTAQPKYETALLDLRNASAARTTEAVGPGSNGNPIEVARGLLTLLVQLPVGSDAGPYE